MCKVIFLWLCMSMYVQMCQCLLEICISTNVKLLRPNENAFHSLLRQTSVTALLIYLIDKYSQHGYKRYAKKGVADIKGDEFRFGNCLWFVGSTLLQQGAELTPMSAPGRIMGATFWFYALILISAYTANLAAVFASMIRFSRSSFGTPELPL